MIAHQMGAGSSRMMNNNQLLHKYHEGQKVRMILDVPILDVKTGDTALIVALYDTDPPAYEIVLTHLDGTEFGHIAEEFELADF
jgi:hypothetical protein